MLCPPDQLHAYIRARRLSALEAVVVPHEAPVTHVDEFPMRFGDGVGELGYGGVALVVFRWVAAAGEGVSIEYIVVRRLGKFVE